MGGVTEFKIKCGKCGLHFALYTWHEDVWLKRTPFCPECGNNVSGSFLIGYEKIDNAICQIIPGDTSFRLLTSETVSQNNIEDSEQIIIEKNYGKVRIVLGDITKIKEDAIENTTDEFQKRS